MAMPRWAAAAQKPPLEEGADPSTTPLELLAPEPARNGGVRGHSVLQPLTLALARGGVDATPP